MPRYRARFVVAVLLLSGCAHHKPVNQAQDEAGIAAVAQNDSELTGLPPQPTDSSPKPVYPRATLVALPSPSPATHPPAEAAVAPSPAQHEDKPLLSEAMPANPPPDASSTAASPSTPPSASAPSSTPPAASDNDAAMPPSVGDSASPVIASSPSPALDDTESQKQVVLLDTSLGRIVIELDDVDAPRTCGNFRKLVSDGFYNHTVFHRVIPNFIIQGGDPNSKSEDRTSYGQGGPGYTLPPEIKLKHDLGAVAMARLPDSVNPQRESNGSQFYICIKPCPSLDDNYTVFAHVIEGMDVVDKIASLPRDSNDDPLTRIEMEASIVSKGKALGNTP